MTLIYLILPQNVPKLKFNLLAMHCNTLSLSRLSCSASFVASSAFSSNFLSSHCLCLAVSLARAASLLFCAASCLFFAASLCILWILSLVLIYEYVSISIMVLYYVTFDPLLLRDVAGLVSKVRLVWYVKL